jgi:glycosyltransferase involved in cell wall biosynthesis
VNSTSIRDTYLSYGWFKEHEIGVIYNGVSVVPDRAPYDVRQIFPQTENRMTILSAGRLDPQKGFTGLLEVAKRAKAMNKAWIFLVAGEGSLRDQIEEQIADFDLAEFIQLIGFQPELRSLMKACDVFVLPSRFEGMPNVVMEAMAEGTPVVASDVNGIKELMVDGEGGYLVPWDSPEQFVDRLVKLEDRDRRDRMGMVARERVLQRFTWERMADQLEIYFHRRLAAL